MQINFLLTLDITYAMIVIVMQAKFEFCLRLCFRSEIFSVENGKEEIFYQAIFYFKHNRFD